MYWLWTPQYHMVQFVVTEELVGLWVQSMVREILYPRLLTCGIIFLFLIYIYPAGRQAGRQASSPGYTHVIYCLLIRRLRSYGWLIPYLICLEPKYANWWLPRGMCVRAQCCGGTKLAHCESITTKFIMQFFASSIYLCCRVKHSYQEMPYSSYLVNFCIIIILIYSDLV